MHQGSAGIGGTAIDIAIQAENLEHMKNVMMRLTAEHTGQPVETIERDAGGTGGSPPRRRARTGSSTRWSATSSSVTSYRAPQRRRFGTEVRGDEQLHDPERHRADRCAGERAVDIYSRLLTDRIVYFGTEIDDGVANVVIAQLLHLESESPDSPIHLYLNSPGGSITAMLAIYDTMQFIKLDGRDDVLPRPGSLRGGRAARGGRTRVSRHWCWSMRAWCCTSRRAGERARGQTWRCRPRRSSGLRGRDGGDPAPPHRPARGEQLRADTDRDLILTAQQAVDYGLGGRDS